MGASLLIVAPSPSRQLVYNFEKFHPGEVNRASQTGACLSGKAINAARILQQLEIPAEVLCFAQPAEQDEFRRAMPLHNFYFAECEAPLRTCTSVLHGDGCASELVEPQAAVGEAAACKLNELFESRLASAKALLLAGSLPPDMPADTYVRWTRQARERAVICTVDAHSKVLKTLLQAPPDCLKPNLEEFMVAMGLPEPPADIEAWLETCHRKLWKDRSGWLCISNGAAGGWSVTGDGVRALPATKVRVINPVGSGDTMSALLLASVLDKGERCGMAARAFRAASFQCETLLPASLSPQRLAELKRSFARENLRD